MTDASTFPRGLKFADDEVHDQWDHETGMPTLHMAGKAIQVWSTMQNRPTSVREAAVAFNLDDAQVRDAVNAHYWMGLVGPDDDPEHQIIEHEGE